MKYTYDKPTIKVDTWLVSKADLKKLYDFFVGRSLTQRATFELDTASGNNREYDSFEEFANDLDVLLSEKETVSSIRIATSDSKDDWRRHGWIQLTFPSTAFFALVGRAGDTSLKDWIEGTYVEMKKLAEIFRIEDGSLKDLITEKYGDRWNSNASIIFDPNEEVRKSLLAEIDSRQSLFEDVPTTSSVIPTQTSILKKIIDHPIITGLIVFLLGTLILYVIYLGSGLNLTNFSKEQVERSSSTSPSLP